MSGFVRRLEKRLMKRSGYTRERWIIVEGIRGEPEVRKVRRGGEITDSDDNPIGRHWPARLPARAKAPTRPQKRAYPGADKAGRIARGSRRGRPSKKWLLARKHQQQL